MDEARIGEVRERGTGGARQRLRRYVLFCSHRCREGRGIAGNFALICSNSCTFARRAQHRSHAAIDRPFTIEKRGGTGDPGTALSGGKRGRYLYG